MSDQTVETAQAAPASSPGAAPVKTQGRGYRKTREGLVVSDKMDKTVVVAVEDRFKHRIYGKVVRRTSRLKAHDERNEAGVGDRVVLMETRPLSATKRWRIVEILEKAK
jgi:small subunit ribosomal protein S17